MRKSNEYIYSRIQHLAGTTKGSVNETITSTLISVENADDGSKYGIVKENHHYFIKRSSKKENLNESDFAYIGGLENKNNYRYDSLSDAEKQRNFYIKSINESISSIPIKHKTLINEEITEEKKLENPIGFLSQVILEGKKRNSVNMQNKFKESLTKKPTVGDSKKGLLPEAADYAIKKALGLINEDALSTADSQIQAADIMANKTDTKESPQAPVNDSNAKSQADKGASQSSLTTVGDSEIEDGDIMANKNDSKESPQAPVNDSNAKSEADKNNVGEGSFETPKKETGAIVNENKDIITADSEITDSDIIADKKGHETPQAPYNNYNQPNKGQKDGAKKGVELKPKESKKDVVAESDLITADSEITDSDIIADKKDTKESPQAPVNDSNAKSQADKNNTGKGSFETSKKEAKAIVNEDVNDDETERTLDAAADALNDLDISIDDNEETPMEPEMGGEVTPEQPEMGGEETPMEPEMGGEEASMEPNGEDEPLKKEIEKLVGKLTQKIRNTDITPEMTQSIMNSVLTSLKNELGDIDIEERKEMSSKIINADGETNGETDGEKQSKPNDLDSDTESAIDQKIESMKNGVNEPELEESDDSVCEECNTFEGYLKSNGYEDLSECSEMEMANMISGYVNDNDDESDYGNIAKYVTPNVKTELEEYGHGDFINKLDPYMQNLSEDQKVTFGNIEPMVNDITEDDDFEETEINAEEIPDEPKTDDMMVPNEPIDTNGFAPTGEVMGIGSPLSSVNKTKSVDVDLNTGKVNVTMSESEIKLRNYIREHLDIISGKKKASLNESKKSETLKKLDILIENEYKELDEGIFGKKKAKFETLDKSNPSEIDNFIIHTFDEMRGSYKGLRLKAMNNMSPEEKHEMLNIAKNDNFGGMLRVNKQNKLIYVPKKDSGGYYGHDLGSPKLGN